MTRAPVLLLFLDGVGLGPADPGINPFFRADLPAFRSLLEDLPSAVTPRAVSSRGARRPAVAAGLDACLGLEGLPQSGTGHTSLFTGRNGPRLFGRHFGPWVPVRLRPVVEEENLLRRAAEAGRSVAFANAYPEGWPGERRARRLAGAPLAARAAGLMTRHLQSLERGEAVASEIVNEGWRRHLDATSLPRITPGEAGANLARIAAGHDLTLFAHYGTDTAGHRGGMEGGVEALERVDAFLGGLLGALPDDHLLVIASDHGNLEDVRGGHTRNPALAVVAGPDAENRAAGLRALTDVAPAILEWLGVA